MVDTPAQPEPTPDPADAPAWTPDPGRWVQGDWAFNPGDTPDEWENDAAKDAPWEDPDLWRRKIGTKEELEAVADAIVRGIEITEVCPHDPPGREPRVIVGWVGDPNKPWAQNHGISEHVIVEDLRALIEAVQDHEEVKLAKVEWEEDANGVLRVKRRWVEDHAGHELDDDELPTELRLWHSIIERTAPMDDDYGGVDTGVTLRLAARFAGVADFRSARFAGEASFWYARFAGEADFLDARFAGKASFRSARFAGMTYFESARFAGEADFWSARFAGEADFESARFAGEADFWSARFAGRAGFGAAQFDGGADFRQAQFASTAVFDEARFIGGTVFGAAQFDGEAYFRQAQFASTAVFNQARFVQDAWFTSIRVRRNAILSFYHTRFKQSCHFDDGLQSGKPFIRGKLSFLDATLDERLTFHETRFGKHVRLGFSRFLARGGATVELTGEQLRLGNPVPKKANTPFKRLGAALLGWVVFHDRSRAIMEGGDSNNPELIHRAANDYELLAANYANQPASDIKEDGCRWMAHELARKAEQIRSWEEVRKKLTEPAHLRPHPAPQHIPDWLWDPIDLLGRGFASLDWLVALTLWVLEHIIGRWLVQRTMVGYLLDWWRPVASGAVLIVVYALLYGLFANEQTIYYSHNTSVPLELWNQHPVGNPLYFSVVTFTSLGYGDIQPKGWFKGLAASEALLGLTLMALFTVSWARKMVR